MPDIILDARIASLEDSLEKVKNLLGWATRRQHCLDTMNKLLQEGSRDLRRLRTDIDHYVHQQLIYAEERGKVPDDLAAAANAIVGLSRLTGQIECGQRELVPLSKFTTDISGRGSALDIQSKFRTMATDLLDSLQSLDRAAGNAWETYEKRVHLPAQALFAAFSEFLAGLALRDSGFDEDICETAEELLKSFAISQASSTDFLTIPIPHEIMETAILEILKAVIQLSYPEWTLWSLPIVAHEFWQAFAHRQPEEVRAWFHSSPKTARAKLDVNDPQLCLADAFGACSMGPAYAFYAFLLSLNPVNAFADIGGEPAAAKRALAIRVMLERTGNPTTANPWKPKIDDLWNSWYEAVRAANPRRSRLSKKTQDQITRAVSILAKALDDTQVPFTATHWERAVMWASDLAQGNVDKIQVDPSDRMRDVLNAAWLARKDASNVQQIADIAKAAVALRKRIPTVRGQVESDFPNVA